MKTSARGRALIEQREGVRLTAYPDPATRGEPYTIGCGHTSAAGAPHVTPGMTITAAQADDILSNDLLQFEAQISPAIVIPLADHEFDACISLAFNIGARAFLGSTVRHKLNAGDRAGAADAFLMWARAGNNPTLLLPRRKAERLQFLTAYS